MQQVHKINLYWSEETLEDNLPPTSAVWVEEADVAAVCEYAKSKGLFPHPVHVVGFVGPEAAIAWIDTVVGQPVDVKEAVNG